MKWPLALALLAGCAAFDPNHFHNMSSARLCIDYMSYPPANIWQGKREEELARRGEDCSAYTNQAAIRQRAIQDQTELGLRLLQTPTPPPRQQACQWQTNANGTGSMVCQ